MTSDERVQIYVPSPNTTPYNTITNRTSLKEQGLFFGGGRVQVASPNMREDATPPPFNRHSVVDTSSYSNNSGGLDGHALTREPHPYQLLSSPHSVIEISSQTAVVEAATPSPSANVTEFNESHLEATAQNLNLNSSFGSTKNRLLGNSNNSIGRFHSVSTIVKDADAVSNPQGKQMRRAVNRAGLVQQFGVPCTAIHFYPNQTVPYRCSPSCQCPAKIGSMRNVAQFSKAKEICNLEQAKFLDFNNRLELLKY